MSRRRPRSTLPRRRLRRESDGSLFDVDERRRIEPSELADDLRAGRFFRAARHSSGEDCTQEVLAQVLASSLPTPAGAGVGAAGSLGSVVTNLLGGLVTASSARLFDDEPRSDRPVRRRRRSADRADWFEGD